MRLLLAVLAAVVALFAYSAATAPPTPTVEVSNFPDPQNVTGSVEVTNFPPSSTPARFQLVGFSSMPVTGDVGVLGMTVECQKDFADSRMCTSVEVMETVNVPGGLAGDAWVRPISQPFHTQVSGERSVDASGVGEETRRISCGGWRSVGLKGLMTDAAGRFGFFSCNLAAAVACCALVP